MSKVSFRARALDATRPMQIFKADEVPDLPDFATINRSVPQMPTGMEKEEETEHHLQRALSAQQVYGTSEALVIPIPEVDDIAENYHEMYKNDFKPSKQFIHIQAYGMDQEIPDYDMDSEDESWVTEQRKKMEINPLKFEEMMDRLEKGSGQQVVTLQEAKLLLKEDDDLIIAVYDYWLNKRLRLEHPLILQVKTEKRDGSTTNNPYVAFRRRTEKMQTRKNRKNDETSYEKMLKLRRDLNRAVTILEMIKRREKAKKEMLQLTIEIMEKRYQGEDFEGKMLQEAESIRHKLPLFIPPYSWGAGSAEEGVRKKREYRKRKHKQAQPTTPTVQPSHYDIDVLHPEPYSSDEDGYSPGTSPSDHEDENDPDGPFAFRRRKNCNYFAPILNRLGNWPWCSPEEGGLGKKNFRYNLCSLSQPSRCIGYARRRVGRGGRVMIDRAATPWDDALHQIDMSSGSYSGIIGDYVTYIRDKRIPHFRPHSPTLEESSSCGNPSHAAQEDVVEFNMESFQSHKEQLLQMQRAQQEQLLKQDTSDLNNSCNGLEHSFSSQPTSRFTLDSDSAKFAVSAVMNTSQIQNARSGAVLSRTQAAASETPPTPQTVVLTNAVAPAAVSTAANLSLLPPTTVLPPISSVITNGPIDHKNVVSSKTTGLSTSPAATVFQLNFPLNNNNASHHSHLPSSSSSLSSSLSALTTSIPNKTVSAVGPNLLKFTPAYKNSIPGSIPAQNHEDVARLNNIHNIKREKVVAMDVT
ncbi:enhancer of polycomb homolog 1-like [Saccostrea cucullata]|uniref:enhancer of polycomb homolog 1-like n=1 Tax=Saccostrea cuccullata TaxID=36930 RepID=UPI002ED56D00